MKFLIWTFEFYPVQQTWLLFPYAFATIANFGQSTNRLIYSTSSGIRQKDQSQNGCFKKAKQAKISEKPIFTPWYPIYPQNTPWYAHAQDYQVIELGGRAITLDAMSSVGGMCSSQRRKKGCNIYYLYCPVLNQTKFKNAFLAAPQQMVTSLKKHTAAGSTLLGSKFHHY